MAATDTSATPQRTNVVPLTRGRPTRRRPRPVVRRAPLPRVADPDSDDFAALLAAAQAETASLYAELHRRRYQLERLRHHLRAVTVVLRAMRESGKWHTNTHKVLHQG